MTNTHPIHMTRSPFRAGNGLRLNTFRPKSRLAYFVAYASAMKNIGGVITARGFWSLYLATNPTGKATGNYRKGYGTYFTSGLIQTELFKVVGRVRNGEYLYDFGPAMTDSIVESLGLNPLTTK